MIFFLLLVFFWVALFLLKIIRLVRKTTHQDDKQSVRCGRRSQPRNVLSKVLLEAPTLFTLRCFHVFTETSGLIRSSKKNKEQIITRYMPSIEEGAQDCIEINTDSLNDNLAKVLE